MYYLIHHGIKKIMIILVVLYINLFKSSSNIINIILLAVPTNLETNI